MCHVWITVWNVTGSFMVTGRPSYLKRKSTIFHAFRGVYGCSTMPGTPSGHLAGLSQRNQTMLHMAQCVITENAQRHFQRLLAWLL